MGVPQEFTQSRQTIRPALPGGRMARVLWRLLLALRPFSTIRETRKVRSEMYVMF